MIWQGRQESTNVEDLRNAPPAVAFIAPDGKMFDVNGYEIRSTPKLKLFITDHWGGLLILTLCIIMIAIGIKNKK